MKTMKAFCTAMVLTLTLSISAFAGEIATPGAARSGEKTTVGNPLTSPSALPANTEIGDLDCRALSDALLTLLSMF